ncbi:hypothetical protein N0V88_007267 [Collariella sp. IMI 366227]|nr:hypothetical protein N0V88_007267 [Collariella sp. IMI 366227]
MLRGLFRGKIDMLNISIRLLIKSIRLIETLFRALDCTTMLVSSSVRQTIEIRGNIVRDLKMEKDLKIRVEHISQEIGFHGELFVSTPFVDHLLFYSE